MGGAATGTSLKLAAALTGATTMKITGASTLGSTFKLAGAATLDGLLDVTGVTTLADTLDVGGAAPGPGAVAGGRFFIRLASLGVFENRFTTSNVMALRR